MQWLRDLETAVKEVAGKVGPSVVGVGDRWALGSGVVVEAGKVLTNAHNLRGEVVVTFLDGRTVDARPLGVDLDGDLAIISADTGEAPAVEWGEDSVGVGVPVFALANPGGRGLRVTTGIVSGTQRAFRGPRGRRITGSFEHTAPLLPGSSGGPVVGASGKVLGINTNRLGEGFYLAIPADATLRERVAALSSGESPSPPRLGVGLAPTQVARRLRRAVGLPEVDGLLVRHVEEDGPAARAGIREGDLLVEAGGRSLASVDHLHEALSALESAEIELKVLRGTEQKTLTVSVENRR